MNNDPNKIAPTMAQKAERERMSEGRKFARGRIGASRPKSPRPGVRDAGDTFSTDGTSVAEPVRPINEK